MTLMVSHAKMRTLLTTGLSHWGFGRFNRSSRPSIGKFKASADSYYIYFFRLHISLCCRPIAFIMTTLTRMTLRALPSSTSRAAPRTLMATSCLQTFSRHIQPRAIYTPVTQRTFITTSNMSSPNNNDAFKLSELFNVKDKVVVVSGSS